jgi:immunoglobulin-like protein involved in spore germination
MQRSKLVWFLMVFLFGCNSVSPSPTVVPASTTAPSLTATPGSTVMPNVSARILNAEYQLGAANVPKTVQLTDGKFQQGVPGDPNYAMVTLTNFVSSGDLNNDGVEDIAALIAENYGGSGVFAMLAVYTDVNGQLTFQSSQLVDDRPQLTALSIQNGEVFLEAVTHASQDPMCCPTLHNVRHYRLDKNNQLVMSDYATFTPDGRSRTIRIDTPTNDTQVYSSVRVRGSVAIAPFENTLAYRIYSTGSVELAAGAVSVTAATPGGPGTFDTTIALGSILSGAVVRVEIQDVSAQDGSLLGMDSVELVVQ